MKSTAALLFLALAASGRGAAEDDAIAKEFKAIAGTWKLVSAEDGGKATPKADLLAITFTLGTDGKASVRVNGGDEFQTKSIIDPTRKPKTLDIEYMGGLYQGQKQYGIYKLDGDRWTVFSTAPGGKAEDRPKEFDSKTAKGALVVWERVKEEKKR
jgi:uncharacterized protein (TIGR03067 family)